MGTPLPKASEDCPTSNPCWISGAFTNPIHSPLYLSVEFKGIQFGSMAGPTTAPALEGAFVLVQTGPITWQAISLPFRILVGLNSIGSTVQVSILGSPGIRMFQGFVASCALEFTNQFSCSDPHLWCGGTAKVLDVS